MLWLDLLWMVRASWKTLSRCLLALAWGLPAPDPAPARLSEDGWQLPDEVRLDWWHRGQGVAPRPGAGASGATARRGELPERDMATAGEVHAA